MKLSKNIFIIFLIIFLILIYYKKYYSKKEEHYSNGILDLLSYNGEPIKYNIEENKHYEKKKDEKKDEIIYKHIYLKNNSDIFKFYNKKNENYLIINAQNKNNIKIKDVDNKNIGNIKHFKYNTFTSLYDDYNVDYTLLYNDKRLIKIIYENDIYYIVQDIKNKKYKIFLFELNIGSIEKINNKYKIIIKEEYKTILNTIAFGLVIEVLRNKL